MAVTEAARKNTRGRIESYSGQKCALCAPNVTKMTHRMGKGLAVRGLVSGGRQSCRSPAIFDVQPPVRLSSANAARWPRAKVSTSMDYSAPTIAR